MPVVSVIIPMYKVEKYLRRCLDSVKNQTFTEWQAICVDDGSPDKSGEIAEEYAKNDKRFVVVHKKNGGVSSARNVGIKESKNSKYVFFLDADDVLEKNHFEEMLKNSENADILCSGFVTNTKYSGNLLYTKKRVLRTMFAKIFWTQALLKSFVWRYFFKYDFIEKNKLLFDTSLISQEDAIFVLDAIALANYIVIVPNINYQYMFNDMSALNNPDKEHQKKLKEQYKIGKKYRKEYAQKHHIYTLWFFRKIIKLFF